MKLDICVSGELRINWEVYRLWVGGHSSGDATQQLVRAGALKKFPASVEMLRNDVLNEYRTYVLLERYLQTPDRLSEACVFPLRQVTASRLLELYYQFDEPVVRDLLGKKLSAKHRRDLDETADKTGVPLDSCRRQFDNLRRVFKAVEELKGSLVANICSLFQLPEHLAKQYAAAVFITNQRFETTKKKLVFLSFADLAFCANEMIAHWSYSSKECAGQDMDQDLDASFLRGLKELKAISDKEVVEELRPLMLSKLQKIRLSSAAAADFDSNYKQILRRIGYLTLSLTTSKDTRDFFLDIVEELAEPWASAGWTCEDADAFLAVYRACAKDTQLFAVRQQQHRIRIWERVMQPLTSCVLKIFAAYRYSQQQQQQQQQQL